MENNPVKLLLSGYWGKEGWKKPSFSPDEIRILIDAGLLRATETLGHNEAPTGLFAVARMLRPLRSLMHSCSV